MKTFLGFDIEEWRRIRFVVFQNFVVITFALMFLWDGWDTEIFKYLSIGALLEFILLLISIPLYFDFAARLYKEVKNHKAQMLYVLFCLIMAMFIIGGTGIHLASNQIRHSVDTPIIEFYDEVLSHCMIWIGIIGLNSFFAFFQKDIPLKHTLGRPEIIVIVASGIIQGIIGALGILESRLGLLGLIFSSLAFFVLSVIQSSRQIRKFPLYIFYDSCLLTIIFCLIMWVIKYGAFLEPSEISFGRF